MREMGSIELWQSRQMLTTRKNKRVSRSATPPGKPCKISPSVLVDAKTTVLYTPSLRYTYHEQQRPYHETIFYNWTYIFLQGEICERHVTFTSALWQWSSGRINWIDWSWGASCRSRVQLIVAESSNDALLPSLDISVKVLPPELSGLFLVRFSSISTSARFMTVVPFWHANFL